MTQDASVQKILSPSTDLVLTGQKLLDDTLNIPHGIRDILPAAFEQVAASIDAARVAGIKNIVLSGVGDLHHAALSSVTAFERLTGIRTVVMPSMQLGLYATQTLPAGSVVTQMSFSGRPDRVVEAATLARQASAQVWAFTLDDTSPLAKASDLCFGKVRGAEVKGIGFHLGLITLLLIAIRIGELRGRIAPDRAERLRARLQRSPDDMERTIALSSDPARALAEQFASAGHAVFLACGPSFGAASNSAARMLEAAGWNASAQDIEEWAHLNRWSADRGSPTFVIAPPGPSRMRAMETLRALARLRKPAVAISAVDDAELASTAPYALPVHCTLPEEFSALVYNLPGELFADHVSVVTGRRPYCQDDPHFKQLGEVRWGGVVQTSLPKPDIWEG